MTPQLIEQAIDIPFDMLYPKECTPLSAPRLAELDQAAAYEPQLPGITVPYQEGFILLDGHHRARRDYQLGHIVTPEAIVTTDEALAESYVGRYLGLSSIAEVHQRYETLWRPRCLAAGITHIATMPIANRDRSRQWIRVRADN
jgi:hypothetical protein